MSGTLRLTEEEARGQVVQLETRHPDFAEIFAATDIDQCCKVDEVAHRHGWGEATDAWSTYDDLRWLLGDR